MEPALSLRKRTRSHPSGNVKPRSNTTASIWSMNRRRVVRTCGMRTSLSVYILYRIVVCQCGRQNTLTISDLCALNRIEVQATLWMHVRRPGATLRWHHTSYRSGSDDTENVLMVNDKQREVRCDRLDYKRFVSGIDLGTVGIAWYPVDRIQRHSMHLRNAWLHHLGCCGRRG